MPRSEDFVPQGRRVRESIAFLLTLALFLTGCIRELSPREACYERNRCEEIEGNCYLRNVLFYQLSTGSSVLSMEDSLILLGTCSGLRGECRKNCESSTLF